MAQPVYAIDYITALDVKAGTPYTTAAILAAYPLATVLQMKTPDVQVSINGSILFHITYDDTAYITTGREYYFDRNCVIAIGTYKAIV